MKLNNIVEKPVFRTKIKSSSVKAQEMLLGYFLAPFCAMISNAIFGSYLNRYYADIIGWTAFGAFSTLLPIVSVIFVVAGNLVVGQLMERTRTTQGKARPYLLLSAPIVAAAIILLFMTPTNSSPKRFSRTTQINKKNRLHALHATCLKNIPEKRPTGSSLRAALRWNGSTPCAS